MLKHAFFLILAIALPTRAGAEPPARIVTDIAPVHGLVSMVTGGLNEPSLLIHGHLSPHSFSLRPSQAREIQEAGFVFWAGPDLLPWMSDALTTLAPQATAIALSEVPETVHLEARAFEEDHHDHGDHGHGHGHDDEHGRVDPHMWLDPENAKIWLAHIAKTLADADPDNAAQYLANADAAISRIAASQKDALGLLAGLGDSHYLVNHDAFQYFESRFGLARPMPVSGTEGAALGASRMRKLRSEIEEHGAVCIFSEPQFDQRKIDAIVADTGLETGVLDPIGSTLRPGADLYPELIRNMAINFRDCLAR